MTSLRLRACQVSVLIVAVPVLIWAFPDRVPAGHAGAPGDTMPSCAPCHAANARPPGSVDVTFPGGMAYEPGARQRLTVRINDPDSRRKKGFQLTARTASNGGVGQAGRFTASFNTAVTTQGSRQYINQTRSANVYAFDWTPPSEVVGDIIIYVTGVAANDTDDSNIYQGEFTLTAPGPVPTTFENGVINSASGSTTTAPGSIVSVFGSDFTADLPLPLAQTLQSATTPLETALGGMSVKFDGIDAPLFVIVRDTETGTGFDQANAQMPWEVDVSDGTVMVEVVNGDGSTSEPREVQVAESSPGIFAFNGQGFGPAIVQNFRPPDDPDSDVIAASFAQSPGAVCAAIGNPPNCSVEEQAAPVGGIVTIWANGFGPVVGNVTSGEAPGASLNTQKQVKVFVGDVEAQVIGSAVLHPTLVGLNQVNAFVPEVEPGAAVTIQMEIDGVRSRDDATIAVRAAPAVAAATK